MFCHELILGFWSDQSETYMYVIYMGWSYCPPLVGGVAPSVFLREGSELSPPQHFDDLGDHFFSSFLSWTRLNKKSKSRQDHIKVTSRSCPGHVEVVTWPQTTIRFSISDNVNVSLDIIYWRDKFEPNTLHAKSEFTYYYKNTSQHSSSTLISSKKLRWRRAPPKTHWFYSYHICMNSLS